MRAKRCKHDWGTLVLLGFGSLTYCYKCLKRSKQSTPLLREAAKEWFKDQKEIKAKLKSWRKK